MSSLALSKILSPNLCWSWKDGITHSVYGFVETLISGFVDIFGGEEEPSTDAQPVREHSAEYLQRRAALKAELQQDQRASGAEE